MSTMPPVVSKPAVTVSPEVYEYTSKHGIEAPLERLLEATLRIYPNALSIKVYMEKDVEEAGLWFIVFEVCMAAADVPDYVAARRPWIDAWMEAYPYPRMHSFVLSLETINP
jgi:hypothetical protein